MTAPLASIIIPVGPAHRDQVRTAVASCRWQTYPNWEAIVVNDAGERLRSVGDDRVRVIDAPAPRPGKRRSSVARNAGLDVARGTFTIYLDADDYLLPTAIETFVRGHATHDAAYSYGHHYAVGASGDYALYRPPEYCRLPRAEMPAYSVLSDRQRLSMQLCNLHPITAFAPTWCLRDVGGVDEDAPGFEDWTVWLRMAIAGWCGERIWGPTFVYRAHTGIQHHEDAAGGRALMDAVTKPYRNKDGDIDMAGCGCGGGAAEAKNRARQVAATLGAPPMNDQGNVILEYIGRGQGTQSFRHPASRREYRAGAHPAKRYIQVPPEDAPYLLGLGFFRQQIPPAKFVPPPVADETQALRPDADAAAVKPRPDAPAPEPEPEPVIEETTRAKRARPRRVYEEAA